MIKREHQIFINEMVRHGDEKRAYKAAYPKANAEGIRKGCLRLSQNVSVQAAIKQEADKIRTIATQEAITELKDEIKATILTATQKREMLYKIATGEQEIEEVICTKFGIQNIKRFPDAYERMKAIEIDNKMSGDNAPDKQETEVSIVWNEERTYEP